MIRSAALLSAMLLTLAGCATTGTNDIVNIGPDLQMLGGLGKVTDFSRSAVKARFYGEAAEYCTERHRVTLPVDSTGRDSGIGTYTTATIQFLCLPPDDPRVSKESA